MEPPNIIVNAEGDDEPISVFSVEVDNSESPLRKDFEASTYITSDGNN